MDPTDGDTMTRWSPGDLGRADPGAGDHEGVSPPRSSVTAGRLGRCSANPDAVDPDAVDRGRLLDAAVSALVAENAAKAARLDAVSVFHARRVEEAEAGSREGPGYFMLTPLQATKAELGPLLAMSELYLQTELDLTDDLKRWFPRLWQQCRAGRLDLGRARLAQAHLAHLLCDDDRAAYAERVEAFVERYDDPSAAIHPVGYTNLRGAARRACLRLPQKSPEETFNEAFSKRRVSLRTDDDTGMAALTCTAAVTEAQRADYRLTLIAKKRAEAEDEERTLEQLRVDTLMDLLMGRLTVGASDASLEHAESEGADADVADSFAWHAVGRFARPVVNVTVPWTTLVGLDDAPGRVAGGARIPAELARNISKEAGATWYRLLTDPAGDFLELSTDSYEPTDAIWRWAVAEHPECVWPTCHRPSTVVDLDHREPYPEGRTSTTNLQPLCSRHHTVKHSQGFSVVRQDDGSFLWTSRFGVTSRKAPPEYFETPVGTVSEAAKGPLEVAAGGAPEASDASGPEATFVERRFAELIASAA